jgi:cytochrome c peroxidase
MSRRLLFVAPLALAALIFARAANLPASQEEEWLRANRELILAQFALGDEDQQLDDRGVSGPLAEDIGNRLFFDARLSKSGTLSCASCHQPGRQWTDGRRVALGLEPLRVNTPTLVGVARLKWLFWDGRAIGLSHQIIHPMTNPAEMGVSPQEIVHLISFDRDYRSAYARYFGPVPTAPCPSKSQDGCRAAFDDVMHNVARLIAAFVAEIPQPHTRFDDLLRDLGRGARSAFTSDEIRGLQLFVEKGSCTSCHSGRDLTDGQFHNVLVPEADGPGVFTAGRYGGLRIAKATMAETYSGTSSFAVFARQEIKRARDDSTTYGAFKTPTLRGLNCTAPYMHNGRFDTIERVIDHYSLFDDVLRPEHHDDPLLAPRNFTVREKADILAFLLTLSSATGSCAAGDVVSGQSARRTFHNDIGNAPMNMNIHTQR